VVNYNYKSVSDHVFHPSSLYIQLVNQVTPSRKSTRVNYDKQNLKSNKKKKITSIVVRGHPKRHLEMAFEVAESGRVPPLNAFWGGCQQVIFLFIFLLDLFIYLFIFNCN